jgi:hypothetical protein
MRIATLLPSPPHPEGATEGRPLPIQNQLRRAFHALQHLAPARRRARRHVGALLLAGGPCSVACSGVPELPIGQLQVALSSGVGDARYRLESAHFELSGDAELSLSSEDDASADSLERSLPEGSYSLELLDGWQLVQVAAQAERPVQAELVSDNPIAFVIGTGSITNVSFQFETRSAAGAPGTEDGGSLHVGIQVDGVGAPALVITEIMKNPEALADTRGEWIELYNAGPVPLSLAGCSLSRADQSFTFEDGISIAPGQYIALANSADPGFVPAATYRGVTLPNSGALSLRVSCGTQLLDAVELTQAAALNRPGQSLSLSASRLDHAANDLEDSWCAGASAYSGDLGTPGRANPDCP